MTRVATPRATTESAQTETPHGQPCCTQRPATAREQDPCIERNEMPTRTEIGGAYRTEIGNCAQLAADAGSTVFAIETDTLKGELEPRADTARKKQKKRQPEAPLCSGAPGAPPDIT